MLLTVLSVNLKGDSLREHVHPHVRQAGGAVAAQAPAAPAVEPALDEAPARRVSAADV